MESVTKRLHISGLSPNIGEGDLAARFASFGTVLTLDGLGKLDGLGQPRPYAFMTLETTKVQLARCMNLLSGTTWKGARLRIGEAKPDFAERIRRENEAVIALRPAKRRRLARGCDGFHAADMTLISPANVKKRAAWRTTPLGRLVRPMRMRPLRPLPLPLASIIKLDIAKSKAKAKSKPRTPPIHTRIVKIDPEKWGSTYMKGLLLESHSHIILPERERTVRRQTQTPSLVRVVVAAEEDVCATAKSSKKKIERTESTKSKSKRIPGNEPAAAAPPSQPAVFSDEVTPQSLDYDFVAEASRSRALLKSMFEGKGNAAAADDDDDDESSDWGGAESMGDFEHIEGAIDKGDKESRAGEKKRATTNEDDDEIEFVPRSGLKRKKKKDQTKREQETADVAEVEGVNSVHEKPAQENKSAPPATVVQTARLKDMFRPREEDAGFSILANLDLDLELDDSINLPPPPPPAPVPVTSSAQTSISAQKQANASPAAAATSLDTTRAFFFPHPSLTPSGSSKVVNPQDVFSLLQAKLGLRSSPGSESLVGKGKGKGKRKTSVKMEMGVKGKGKGAAAADVVPANDMSMGMGMGMGAKLKFCRTEDADAAKGRWEARRMELTRDWKRRHREALKTARRRGGGGRD